MFNASTSSNISSVDVCATIRATATQRVFVTSATSIVMACLSGYTISPQIVRNRCNWGSVVAVVGQLFFITVNHKTRQHNC
jgi:hypothetical protein